MSTSSQAAAPAPIPSPAKPVTAPLDAKNDPLWRQAMRLPCGVSILVPVPGFKVRDLLGLRVQSVVGSRWPTSENLPFKVNGELMAWCEFEVLGNQLAVRLTELA